MNSHYWELKNRVRAGFSYKSNAAVDAAPNFASRLMTNFRLSHVEFAPPPLDAGIFRSLGGGDSYELELGSPCRRAETVAFPCAKVLHSLDFTKWASSKIPRPAVSGVVAFSSFAGCRRTRANPSLPSPAKDEQGTPTGPRPTR
jgi:hypothetical protein